MNNKTIKLKKKKTLNNPDARSSRACKVVGGPPHLLQDTSLEVP
jgi:hypothetical protein